MGGRPIFRYRLDDLEPLQAQHVASDGAELKIAERGQSYRVWLGPPVPDGQLREVRVDQKIDGGWKQVDKYPAKPTE